MRTGQLQLMKDELDDTCLVINTGMQVSSIKWNSNGSVLAVSGLLSNNTGPAAAMVQFYSHSGECVINPSQICLTAADSSRDVCMLAASCL